MSYRSRLACWLCTLAAMLSETSRLAIMPNAQCSVPPARSDIQEATCKAQMIHVACRPARARGVPSESKQPGVDRPKLPSRHPPEITANPRSEPESTGHMLTRECFGVFWN